jgi:hypothetical protein
MTTTPQQQEDTQDVMAPQAARVEAMCDSMEERVAVMTLLARLNRQQH